MLRQACRRLLSPVLLKRQWVGVRSLAQAALAHKDCGHDSFQGEDTGHRQDTRKLDIYYQGDALQIDFENVDFSSLENDVLDTLVHGIYQSAKSGNHGELNLNYFPEGLYVSRLNGPMTKLGYKGQFTRYNTDLGRARFVLTEHEHRNCNQNRYKSSLPNPC